MLLKKSQSCGNCDAWLHERLEEGVCRAEPPTPIMVGMTQAAVVIGGDTGPQPYIRSYFPPMFRKGWCRRWALKVDGEA